MATSAQDPEAYAATHKMFSDTIDHALANHGLDPKETLMKPAAFHMFPHYMHKVFPMKLWTDMEAKRHMGNYVINRDTGEKTWEHMSIIVRLGMHLLYFGSEQEKALHWKTAQKLLEDKSVQMGKEYEDPKSKEHIAPFIKSFELENTLSELKKENPDDYTCFNEFFARELKDDARPIAEPSNDHVISSPADSRLNAFPTVDLATKYWIKGYGFTLAKLLGSEDLARQFDGGSIVIARLAPQDYHRFHAPVSGTVESVSLIPGTYYTVNPQAITEPGSMDVFCENKRSVMVLKRKETGSPVALVAVGAMLVGSIEYNPGLDQPGATVSRGQCIGCFKFGGSTVINVYPKGEVVLDADLVKNSTESQCETLVRVGWRVGITEGK